MANANSQDKHRVKQVGALSFTTQSTCPISSGEVGFWEDSGGDLKRRNSDGTDTLIAGGNAVTIISVDAVSTSAIASATYANGTAGVGATLTAVASGTLSIDGVSMTAGKIALLTAESAGANNGVYSVTTAGTSSVKYVLTRLGDFDESAEMLDGTLFLARAGTTNADTTWKYTTASAPTVGTTSLTFSRDPGVVTTNSAQTVSAAKTFNDATLKQNNPAGTYAHTFASSATAARTWTFPDATDVAVGIDGTQTLSNKTIAAPVLSGVATGTYSLGGTPTIAANASIAAGVSLTFASGSGGLDANLATGAFRFGTSSATVGFFGVAASALLSSTGSAAGFTSATGDPVLAGSTFTGNTGTAAYTVDDIVYCLKIYGLLKA